MMIQWCYNFDIDIDIDIINIALILKISIQKMNIEIISIIKNHQQLLFEMFFDIMLIFRESSPKLNQLFHFSTI